MRKIIFVAVLFCLCSTAFTQEGGYRSIRRDKTVSTTIDTLIIDSLNLLKTIEIKALGDTLKVTFPQGSTRTRDTTKSYEIIKPNESVVFEDVYLNRIYTVGVSSNSRYQINVYFGKTKKRRYSGLIPENFLRM